MAVPKVMGTETEYGHRVHSKKEDIKQDPFATASLIVSYVGNVCNGNLVVWDPCYEQGNFDLFTQTYFTDWEDAPRRNPSAAFLDSVRNDVLLQNGARVYNDHGHPEYSTPECLSIRELVAQEKAGERCLEAARRTMMKLHNACSNEKVELLIWKRNNDYKGHSFGAHENYLVDRTARDMRDVMNEIVPHFITRILYCGSGDVKGEGYDRHFEISSRAECFTQVSHIGTMGQRPIFNTRDEPHAEPEKYLRLHVICGDANMSELSIFLRNGTTALILQMIEDKYIDSKIDFRDPVHAFHEISKDLTLKKTYDMTDGRKMTALNVQEHYFSFAKKYAENCGEEQKELVSKWEFSLDGLKNDWRTLDRHIDWIIQNRLLTSFMESRKVSINNDKVRNLAMHYGEIGPKGGYNQLCAKNLVERILTEDEIKQAMISPPENTRAYFRANAVKKFRQDIMTVNWEGITSKDGEMIFNPLNGTKELVGKKLSSANSIEELRRCLYGK